MKDEIHESELDEVKDKFSFQNNYENCENCSNILIVDDDAFNLITLQLILNKFELTC